MPPRVKAEPVMLQSFNLNKLKPTNSIVCIAKRNSGKTVLIKNILHHFQNIQFCVAVSATDKYNEAYKSVLRQQALIFEDYSDGILDSMVKRQNAIRNENEVRKKNKQKLKNPNAVIVLDDILADSKKIFNSKTMRWMFFNGRHIDLMVIVALQYAMDMPPSLRSNTDFIFLLKDNNRNNLERYYENFAPMFDNFAQFKATFDYYTQNFGMLVIDNTYRGSNICEGVFHYKANPNLPDFKIG